MKKQTLTLIMLLDAFLFCNSLQAQWQGTSILKTSNVRSKVLIGSINNNHAGIGSISGDSKLIVVGDITVRNGAIRRDSDTAFVDGADLELYGSDNGPSGIPKSTIIQSGRQYTGSSWNYGTAPLTAAWNVVGVGTGIDYDKLRTGGYKFAVKGKMIAEEVVVKLYANWPDFVFAKNHQLTPLNELEQFIKANQHLPGIPSESEMKEKDGINVSEIVTAQMQKIEELTLYLIEQDKQIKELQALVKGQKGKR